MQHRRRLRITAARKNEDGDVRVLTLVHTHSLIRSRCRPALPLYHPCLVIKDTLTNNIHSLYHPTLWETEVSVWAVSSTRTLVWFVLTKTCCNGHKKKRVLRIEKKKQLKGYSVQKNKKQIKYCNLSKVTIGNSLKIHLSSCPSFLYSIRDQPIPTVNRWGRCTPWTVTRSHKDPCQRLSSVFIFTF